MTTDATALSTFTSRHNRQHGWLSTSLLKRIGYGLLAVVMGLAIVALPPAFTIVLLVTVVLTLAALVSPVSVLAILVVLAPLRALLSTSGAYPLPIDIGQLLLASLLAAMLLHRILHRETLIPVTRITTVHGLLLLFITVSGLTVFNAVSVGDWLLEWLKWVEMLAVVLVIQWTVQRLMRRWVVFALVVAGIGQAIIGLYVFLGGSGANHLLIDDRFYRAFGTFSQPNPFGGFMGLILPFAIIMVLAALMSAIRRWRVDRRLMTVHTAGLVFYAASSAIIAVALIASWSRGAWLSAVIALSVGVIALPRRVWQQAALVATVVVLGGGVWFSGVLPASISDRIASSADGLFTLADVRASDVTSANYAVLERLAHWQAATNMLRTSPWLGHGLGNYEAVYPTHRLLYWPEPLGHAHNYYLNILAEAGIIGGLAYIGFWLGILLLAWRCRQLAATESLAAGDRHPEFARLSVRAQPAR